MSDATPQDFVLTDELDARIEQAAEMLRASRRTLALTGAGLSVESGIPPFRGPGGLWTKYGEPPMDGYQRFLADPAREWRERLSPTQSWARGLLETLSGASPNGGHIALADLERMGQLACVITQNVDDLHRQAGTRALLEIHGNYFLLRCIQCVERFEPEQIDVDPENLPPLCPRCGGIVKSDTVSFGEPIPPDVLRRCFEEVELAECMLVAGTSATVYPAAEFPLEILRCGGGVIEVNPYDSELTPLATLALRGPGSAVLGRLVHHLERALEKGAR